MPDPRHTALITGSTSGIGLAIALRLARSGYTVTLNHANDRAAAALSLCRGVDPGAQLVKADIARPAVPLRLSGRRSRRPAVEVLVNNAARVIDKPAPEMTGEDWDHVMDVNLKGAFLCSQHAARQMLTQDDGGVIVNIGASTGIRGRRNGGQHLRVQCRPHDHDPVPGPSAGPKIRVNTVIPGLTVTGETMGRFDLGNPATRLAREEAVPLRRLGQAGDVADALMLIFMLSSEAGFITGQRLIVDGGQNMW